MRTGTFTNVSLKRSVVKLVHVLFNVLLEDFVVNSGHVLDASDDVIDVFGGLFELRDPPMEDVIAPKAPGQPGGRYQCKEAEKASNWPRFSMFGTFGVAASCT